VFEGRSREWSGWGRDWSQNGLVLEGVFEGHSRDWSENGEGTGLRVDYFEGSV
jgi:hypothetical protein